LKSEEDDHRKLWDKREHVNYGIPVASRLLFNGVVGMSTGRVFGASLQNDSGSNYDNSIKVHYYMIAAATGNLPFRTVSQ